MTLSSHLSPLSPAELTGSGTLGAFLSRLFQQVNVDVKYSFSSERQP